MGKSEDTKNIVRKTDEYDIINKFECGGEILYIVRMPNAACVISEDEYNIIKNK